MMTTLKLELLYGTRWLLRDNWLCDRLVRRLRRHETMTSEEIDAKRTLFLHKALHCAISKLPYYSHIPARFPVARSPEVLQNYFPIVSKSTLLDNRNELYPNSGRPRPWHSIGKTSGTTGTPLSVFRSPKSVLMENAFLKRHWEWGGYHGGMRRATLRGEMIIPLQRTTPPFWTWNRYNNQLLISSRHLKSDCVDPIIDQLEQFSPTMLQAYPSTAFTLAQFMAHRNRRLSIPHVFTASEPLYSHQRKLIEERFGAKVMDMYGMAERVAFATECEFGSLHVNPDYSYVEIVDANGQATDDYGFIVGTTFHNLTMPLVRYQLTDRTRWIPGRCACKRPFPMIEPITGKFEDSIYGSNGAFVSPSVLTFAFKGLKNIQKSQVAQVGPGRWEVRVVPAAGFDTSDRQKLIDNIHSLVDSHVSVDVILRDDLPATAAGKFRWVVNEWSRSAE